MARPYADLSGNVFGRVTVLRRVGTRGKQPAWECTCECGNTFVTVSGSLKNGWTNSCGCLREEMRPYLHRTHGMEHTTEYRSWCHLKERCYNTGTKNYADYGGRGITVCDRWRNDFSAFYADMGLKPTAEHSIDRIDNDGPYSPENCRWATSLEQKRNRRTVRHITVNGETRLLREWAAIYGFRTWKTLDTRLRLGWSIERALTTPVR